MAIMPDTVTVIAGLPGAGKTTLVNDIPGVLDSDRIRIAWEARLGRLPYALWRPALHAWHLVSICRSPTGRCAAPSCAGHGATATRSGSSPSTSHRR